jgi:hypothetical protein
VLRDYGTVGLKDYGSKGLRFRLGLIECDAWSGKGPRLKPLFHLWLIPRAEGSGALPRGVRRFSGVPLRSLEKRFVPRTNLMWGARWPGWLPSFLPRT